MNDIQELFKQWREKYGALDGRGRITFWAGAAGVLVFLIWMFLPRAPAPVVSAVTSIENTKAAGKQENGYFLGEDIGRKALGERLEAQYFAMAEKNKALDDRLDDVAQKVKDMVKAQGRIMTALSQIEGRMLQMSAKAADPGGLTLQAPGGKASVFDGRHYQMDVINVGPVKARDERTVYLPAGSFVRATLLTGVYAPSESSNPLPVLIRLNEAFYGPNDVRIPLEGAFAIGKATGDLNSERALVQITTISSIFPAGETFEHKGNIGYLTDTFGQLGLKGIVVRNTGGQLAMSFMTGFMGGASQAMADSQTTTVTGTSGQMARNVSGSRAKNAGFQGLSQSAAQMSKYYDDQLDKIVPAVKVDAGVEVYLIILEGVEIHGRKTAGTSLVHYID